MLKVNNKKAISKLSFSGIKENIKKYIVLILAVALTSLMFTALFTIGGSLMKELQLSTMRQVGGSCHAGFKYLTQKEYDMFKDDSKIKDLSYRVTVGTGANKEFNKLRTEVNYCQDDNAKACFCYPEVGKMPEKENEIVTSDLVLQKMGVPVEVGSTVNLTIAIGEEEVTKDFVVSGYYRGDIISSCQMTLVSKEFQEKYAPIKTTPVDELTYNDYAGWIMADFNYANSFNIEKKTNDLIARTGMRENVDYGINWAYVGRNMDPTTVVFAITLLTTVMLAGYLIIYNIFYINVISDIKEYGLLKTIGTTGKQLRKIVRKRARLIAISGIPLGIIPGILIGVWLLPMISGTLNTVSFDKGQAHLNIWIILGAVAFTYITVILSANKPCRKAGSVSPIEALRTTEDNTERGNRKKIIIVVMSLSLSLVILNTVMSLMKGFSMDSFIKNMVVADYSVQDAALDNPGTFDKTLDGVTDSFLEELSSQEGVEEIGNIYIYDDYHDFDDENWKKIKDRVLSNESILEYLKERYTGQNGIPSVDDYLESLDEEKTLDGATYGINEMVFNKLGVVKTIDGSDKIDWEKFNSGNYVLVNCAINSLDAKEAELPYFEPGEKVTVRSHDEKYVTYVEGIYDDGSTFQVPNYDNEPVKEYEVYAVVSMPYAMVLQQFGNFQCDYFLPEKEFLDFVGDRKPMRTLINVDKDNEEQFDKWISDYTETVETDLSYKSKQTVLDEYRSFAKTIEIVGFVLAFILGIIGILNFANTMTSSIIVRARELAVLEAVGMTGKQQKIKLMKEGLVYFGWTFVVSIVVSILLNVTVIKAFVVGSSFFVWKFTIIPVLACLPVIGILVAVIPVIAYSIMCRVSVVDRLRFE
ncbi:MAG: ABC transporter permease [Lachnospiraceae bacterium]|nr:ABC transporter permease [Lachnospiraceae bacterium]